MARRRTTSRDRRTASRPIEPTTTGRSTVSVARAHKRARTEMPAILYRPRAERPKPQTVQADLTPPVTKKREPTKQVAKTATKEKSKQAKKPLDLTPASNCKKRPRNTKGNGNSRAFIPYCKGK